MRVWEGKRPKQRDNEIVDGTAPNYGERNSQKQTSTLLSSFQFEFARKYRADSIYADRNSLHSVRRRENNIQNIKENL